MNRRALLETTTALSSAGIATLTAGCLGALEQADESTDSTPPTSTTTRTSCEVSGRVDVGDVEIPDTVTRESAGEVALFVEEAYARNRAEAEGWNVSGVDSTDTTVEPADVGFHARAAVSLDAVESDERADDGTTVAGSLYYDGWYHVTENRIERASGRNDAPPEDGWTTVACA